LGVLQLPIDEKTGPFELQLLVIGMGPPEINELQIAN
jgi:hypothetical protein